jgi:hypothetical protein
MKNVTAALLVATLCGCVGLTPMRRDVQREFTFDYSVPSKAQVDIWRAARDFFAEAYGDSRAVFRVMDESDGTIIGRGIEQWNLSWTGNVCSTEYHVRFAAKEGKARLQLELIDGVPAGSECSGWPWPTEQGYSDIVASFNEAAKMLEAALLGHGSTKKLKDF